MSYDSTPQNRYYHFCESNRLCVVGHSKHLFYCRTKRHFCYFIYGDLNSRCGDLHDYVDNIVYSEDINNIISSDAVNEDNIRSRLSDC